MGAGAGLPAGAGNGSCRTAPHARTAPAAAGGPLLPPSTPPPAATGLHVLPARLPSEEAGAGPFPLASSPAPGGTAGLCPRLPVPLRRRRPPAPLLSLFLAVAFLRPAPKPFGFVKRRLQAHPPKIDLSGVSSLSNSQNFNCQKVSQGHSKHFFLLILEFRRGFASRYASGGATPERPLPQACEPARAAGRAPGLPVRQGRNFTAF